MNRHFLIIMVAVAVLIAFMIVSPIGRLVWGPVYGKFDQWRYRSTDDFRESDWKRPNLKYRYAVLNHVATKVIVVGMTQEEVERVLGKPGYVTEAGAWHYETKRPGWYFIDFSGGGLLIEFDAQHRVSSVSTDLWID